MMNTKNSLNVEQKRLAWRCRRGMLELDIVLQRFVNNALNTLSSAELVTFDAMLELADNDFWNLLNGSEIPSSSADLEAVVGKIKAVKLNDDRAI
ncbi:MAG: succinate dehydrogenase assembly factor 2 [Methylophilaceae bacterium]